MTALRFACCFCGETIEARDYDPCSLALRTRFLAPETEQMNQQLFCHADCLRAVIHVSVPLSAVNPAIFPPGYGAGQCAADV